MKRNKTLRNVIIGTAIAVLVVCAAIPFRNYFTTWLVSAADPTTTLAPPTYTAPTEDPNAIANGEEEYPAYIDPNIAALDDPTTEVSFPVDIAPTPTTTLPPVPTDPPSAAPVAQTPPPTTAATAPITTTTTTRPTTTTTTRPTTTTTRPTTTQPTSRITTTIPTTGGNNPMLQQGSHTDNAVAAPKNGEADPRAVLSYKMNAVDGYFYNENDSWQRNFGFMKAYDQAAQFAMMFYDTVRFRFTADGHDWQVQIWKGQYGFMFLGVEVGVYFLPEGRARDQSWYRCVPDEYRLNMTTAMFVDGKFMAKRPFQEYWWCTTFVPGNLERNSDRSKIRMEWVVEMRSDAMADAFEQSVIAHGFAKASESYNSILKNGFKHSDEYARNGKRFALNWLLIGAPRPNSSRAY